MNNTEKLDNVHRLITGYNGGNNGGQEPPMELVERVGRLELAVSGIEKDVAVIKSNYATREDLHKEISSQTWKLVTYVTSLFITISSALVAATYFIAQHAK